MSKNRITASIVLVVAAASLSGCADYLNHYDTVTLEAGNAQKHNQLLHTTVPFNPASGAVTSTLIPGIAMWLVYLMR